MCSSFQPWEVRLMFKNDRENVDSNDGAVFCSNNFVMTDLHRIGGWIYNRVSFKRHPGTNQTTDVRRGVSKTGNT